MNPGRRSASAAELRDRLMTLGGKGATPEVPFLDWVGRVPEPKRGPLDFTRFPFQRELYEQGTEDRELVVKKATQVGISAFCIRWAMYWADQAGLTSLYVFPHQRQLADFSTTRIRPVIEGSEYLRERVGSSSAQSAMLKQLGSGYLYLRGSESVADLQAIDADALVLDEYDLLHSANIPDAERRLGASDRGLICRVGVPSLPGFGISELYASSDRRRWHVRCQRCAEWQPLTFAENIDVEALERVCRRCRRRLEAADGEWVPEFPDRDVRGYHVPRLIVPQLDVKTLVREWGHTDPARRQAFFNKDLGEEYAPADARLTAELIRAAQRDYPYPGRPVTQGWITMGVDVASVRGLHVRISEHQASGEKHALLIEEVQNFEALDDLMDIYGVHMCAIDAQPERRLARAFADRYAGRVYLVTYGQGSASEAPAFHDEERRMTISRVDAIDEVLESIRRQRNLLPRQLPPGYVSHLQAAIRAIERDQSGRRRAVYRSLGPDDYLHAEVFDSAAREVLDYRTILTDLREPRYAPLDDLVPEFRRSLLASYDDDPEYHPGPPGPGDELFIGF